MWSEFVVYAQLGFQHIVDLAGYDHILFIAALAIPFGFRDWRRLALLVTAFTVGHSITLALATLRLVSVSSTLVEALIPVTILVTALLALRSPRADHEQMQHVRLHYLLAAGFGLIHGLGFSSYLRSLLGAEESIALPLLAFNVGLEVGQLLILCVVLAFGALMTRFVFSARRWSRISAAAIGALALMLLLQRLP